jgi:hypothetical protein
MGGEVAGPWGCAISYDMRILRHIPVSLLGSFVISGILHAAAIISAPGISVPGVAGLFSEKILSADLVQDMPVRNFAGRTAEKQPGVYSPAGLSAKEDVRPEGKDDEGATSQDSSPAVPEMPREAALPVDEEKTTGPEDLTDGEGDEGPVKLAKYIPPERGVLSHVAGRAPGIINFKREKFSYDIFWLGIYVGKAVLEAVDEGGVVRITSQVHSAPVISALYKVEDYAESRVKDGRPSNFRIRQHEGRYRSDKETIFDADGGKIIYYDYLKGLKDVHPVTGGIFWDVISGFYYLRTKGLESEKKVFVDIFDSNKVLNAEISVLGRERVKFGEGEIEAIIVRPVLKSEGLFQNKGDIRIWLSSDENRMPLKVETKVSIGKVTAELKQVETEK